MKFGQAKDIVRDRLGAPNMAPTVLDGLMDGARQEIEQLGDFYWMVGKKDFSLIDGTQSYGITGSGAGNLGLTNYKLHRYLFIRDVDGTQYRPIPIGSWGSTLEEYVTDVKKKPKIATIDNDDIWFFPTPDNIYPCRFLYFDWTSNPSDDTSDDEILQRWPWLLIAGAVKLGLSTTTSNPSLMEPWEKLFQEQLEKAKDFTNKRLEEIVNQMSAREAAQILQAQVKR